MAEFHVNQRVRVTENVGTIFFGVGVIACLEERQALVEWNNRLYKTDAWVSQRDLHDADDEGREEGEQGR